MGQNESVESNGTARASAMFRSINPVKLFKGKCRKLKPPSENRLIFRGIWGGQRASELLHFEGKGYVQM